MRGKLTGFVLGTWLVAGTWAHAGGPALVRIERQRTDDRAVLLARSIPLVLEHQSFFLALGDAGSIEESARPLGHGTRVVDADTTGWSYFVVGLRGPATAAELAACGQVVMTEENWALLRSAGPLSQACSDSPRWFTTRLPLRTLGMPVPPPPEYRGLQLGETPTMTPKPLVSEIVSAVTDSVVSANWNQIINAASTRYSTSTGCQTAAQTVFNKLDALGLETVTQAHTTGHAPNVIATITGVVSPEKVVIVIGHLDDMPSSGAAPGADDNASGVVAVTTAAQVMAGYSFSNTVKFIAVTGEEFGLYGSDYYAAQAASAGEQIQAVLNADMIGWQGDGLPSTGETLDLNLNSSSQWLGTLFAQCASDYGTGCTVDAFLCAGMTASDHYPFWERGYSAVCGITDNEGYCSHAGHYPYYHTASDTRTNCGAPAFFYGAVRAYVATLAHLADPLCSLPLPVPPATLDAQPGGDNHITLSWPSAGVGLTYHVYRAPGGCSGGYPPVKVGETTGLSFEDSSASGGITYAYQVRASRSACLSDWSPCVEASTTGDCLEAPSFGGVGSVTNPASATCRLSLAWSAAKPWCGESVAYTVYRGDTPAFVPSEATRIASGVSATSYDDAAGLVGGTTYTYLVRAVDTTNGTEDTNTTRRSGVPTGPIVSGSWGDDAGDTGSATLVVTDPWVVSTTGGRTGPRVYKTGYYGDNLCVALTTPPLQLGTGASLTFWSKYEIENGYDKGQVEITTDGGLTWTRVAANYPTTSTRTGDTCGLPSGQKYFTGTNLTWASYQASLAAWSNQTVMLRWRLSTDVSGNGQGWWVDDITVSNVLLPGSCTTGAACSLTCAADVPGAAEVGSAVPFVGSATPTGCVGAATYAWSFGDGASSSEQSPGHTFTAPGTYAWSMTVTVDGTQCSKSGTTAVSMALSPTGLSVDGASATPGSSNANGVLEPGESVVMAPTWHNGGAGAGSITSIASGFGGPAGPVYLLVDASADYGTIAPGTNGTCTTDCFGLSLSNPATRPSTHWDATVTETINGVGSKPWTVHVGGSFTDVPVSTNPGDFYYFIETLLHSGTTLGCAVTAYCPINTVVRAEAAMFVARAMNDGSDAAVPSAGTIDGWGDYTCTPGGISRYADVGPTALFCRHVNYMAAHGIIEGCDEESFCPGLELSRWAMAVFVARAITGGDAAVPLAYTDPSSGREYDCDETSPNLYFSDVTAASPYCRHVHYLWARGMVNGCTAPPAPRFCTTDLVRRDQMAKFLVNGFGLRLNEP